MDILIVDDDSTYGFLLKRAFRLEQMESLLRLVEDARGARSALEEQLPGVVLLDLNLPDASGLEVLAWIRQRWWVPVLMHSWSVSPQDRAAARAAGANGFVEKKASLDTVRALIGNLRDYWLAQNRF